MKNFLFKNYYVKLINKYYISKMSFIIKKILFKITVKLKFHNKRRFHAQHYRLANHSYARTRTSTLRHNAEENEEDKYTHQYTKHNLI